MGTAVVISTTSTLHHTRSLLVLLRNTDIYDASFPMTISVSISIKQARRVALTVSFSVSISDYFTCVGSDCRVSVSIDALPKLSIAPPPPPSLRHRVCEGRRAGRSRGNFGPGRGSC